ncbi:MAG: 30S ribosomal protein S8 [Acidobacteriota bacterium]
MGMTDPISDLLTRIRNATTVRHDRTDVPASKMKLELAKILKQEGFIRTFKVIEEGPQGTIRIYLKYADDGEPVIHGLQRMSRPGCRIYRGVDELPKVRRPRSRCDLDQSGHSHRRAGAWHARGWRSPV